MYVTYNVLPSGVSAARFGSSLGSGWPGTDCHVLPPSVVRKSLSGSAVMTPAYAVGVGAPLLPLALSKSVKTIPVSFSGRAVSPVLGKEVTCVHVAAWSALCQSPLVRVP
jgi:hypothetical protein